MAQIDQIPFKLHPRVFAALGADLVTSDVVALTELVKNSYDAFASNVWISFGETKTGEKYIKIKDDGQGMTRNTIENVWCTVATPFRHDNPVAVSGDKKRRVSGDKGLGRLSVARLGSRLVMITKPDSEPCWKVMANWSDISSSSSIDSCFVTCEEYEAENPFSNTATATGTIILILGLNTDWDEDIIDDLGENLGRLISPFSKINDFSIYMDDGEGKSTSQIKIEIPEFLSRPTYLIKGEIDINGNVSCRYEYSSISSDKKRAIDRKMTWYQVLNTIKDEIDRRPYTKDRATCGEFSFEIRAWDISAEDTKELAVAYSIDESSIRKTIKAHKGISVYRDGILVLPKSEKSRDWLGLDLRRVSKVGTRMSTSQLVGHVSIGAERNPGIKDTSDRERLVHTQEALEFELLLKVAVGILENERDIDRIKREKEKPLQSLFSELSADNFLSEYKTIAKEGASASDALSLVEDYGRTVHRVRDDIQKRFVYYSRLATIGTIAQMLVHEIRNRTTAIGIFIDNIKSTIPTMSSKLHKNMSDADTAVDHLERLADTFAPLASRTFKRRKRKSNLKTQIESCIGLQEKEISNANIQVKYNEGTDIEVAVDPGELDSIILNLMTNAIYWLSSVEKSNRQLVFSAAPVANTQKILVRADDSGVGISNDIVDRVLLPGVTKRPEGIGMGLTVASELVAEYGGQVRVEHPGKLGGASFVFDLPRKT